MANLRQYFMKSKTVSLTNKVIHKIKPNKRQIGPIAMPIETESVDGLTWNSISIEIGLQTHLEDFKQHLLHYVRPEWNSRNLTSRTFDAGTTNALFAIYDKDKGLMEDTILLRVNGEGTENLINRRDEIIAFLTLHSNHLNPPFYAQLRNGMCYGFMNGTPLTTTDFQDPVIICKVVKALIRIHTLDIPVSFQNREPQVWYKSEQWLQVVPSEFEDTDKQRCFIENIGSLDDLKREMDEIKCMLKDVKSPVVFCHNDLCSGNIIYNHEKDEVGVIDLEYAGPNYLAYEIADHFCEFAGVHDVNFDLYPSEDVQKHWIKTYLEESNGGAVTSAEIHDLYREVNKFALVCHLFWTVWGLFQAQNSSIDFDYIGYAGIRYREYKKRKEEFLVL